MIKNLNFIISIKTKKNVLSNMIKQSEHKYFNKYFQDNWNDMENTRKGIKIEINLNNSSSDVPRTLSFNDVTTSNPCDIANTFNNYFTSIAKKQR